MIKKQREAHKRARGILTVDIYKSPEIYDLVYWLTFNKLQEAFPDIDEEALYEIVDEEIMDLAQAAGGFYHLTPEGKARYVAARKSASVAEAKSLRAHGEDLLSTNHHLTLLRGDEDGTNEAL